MGCGDPYVPLYNHIQGQCQTADCASGFEEFADGGDANVVTPAFEDATDAGWAVGHHHGPVNDYGVCAESEGFVELEYEGFGHELLDDLAAFAVPGGGVDDSAAIIEGAEADVQVIEARIDKS